MIDKIYKITMMVLLFLIMIALFKINTNIRRTDLSCNFDFPRHMNVTVDDTVKVENPLINCNKNGWCRKDPFSIVN